MYRTYRPTWHHMCLPFDLIYATSGNFRWIRGTPHSLMAAVGGFYWTERQRAVKRDGHCCRSAAGTVHNLASISVDLQRAVLSLQDVSNGNDVIGVGADDHGVHGGAVRGDLSPTASSDHVDTSQGTQGDRLCQSRPSAVLCNAYHYDSTSIRRPFDCLWWSRGHSDVTSVAADPLVRQPHDQFIYLDLSATAHTHTHGLSIVV